MTSLIPTTFMEGNDHLQFAEEEVKLCGGESLYLTQPAGVFCSFAGLSRLIFCSFVSTVLQAFQTDFSLKQCSVFAVTKQDV